MCDEDVEVATNSPLSQSPRNAQSLLSQSPRTVQSLLSQSPRTVQSLLSQSPRTAQSLRVTSRPKTCGNRPHSSQVTPRATEDNTEVAKGQGQAVMYFTVTSSRELPRHDTSHRGTGPAFPTRQSSFVNSFKQQQRINSGRQMFQDGPLPRPHTPSLRTRSASATPISHQFPVTRLASFQNDKEQPLSCHSNESEGFVDGDKTDEPPEDSPDSGKITRNGSQSRRLLSKSAGMRPHTRGQLSSNNLKPFMKNPHYTDQKSRQYVVRGIDNEATLIDKDTVVFIKKDKRQAEYDETTNYIAQLRKLYLNEPKDLAKVNKIPKTSKDKVSLIRERMEYDKRTCHILNYYNRFNEKPQSASVRNQPSFFYSRPSVAGRTLRAKSSRERRQPSSPSIPSPLRTRSQSARPNVTPRSHSQPYSFETFEQQQLEAKRDALVDWDVFLKINHRSTIQERSQFYLQTPVTSSHRDATNSNPDCECQLCQIEMDMVKKHGKDGPYMFISNTQDEDAQVPAPQMDSNVSELPEELSGSAVSTNVAKLLETERNTESENCAISELHPTGVDCVESDGEAGKQLPPLVIPGENISQSGESQEQYSVRTTVDEPELPEYTSEYIDDADLKCEVSDGREIVEDDWICRDTEIYDAINNKQTQTQHLDKDTEDNTVNTHVESNTQDEKELFKVNHECSERTSEQIFDGNNNLEDIDSFNDVEV